jgi:hypothetical protein
LWTCADATLARTDHGETLVVIVSRPVDTLEDSAPACASAEALGALLDAHRQAAFNPGVSAGSPT